MADMGVDGQGLPALSPSDINTVIDGQPRILDVRLAEVLGFSRPRDIRPLIERHRAALERLGRICGTVPQIRGRGRPATEYWLTKKQAIFITTKAETERATDATIGVVEVFDAVTSGAASPPGLSADEREALTQYRLLTPKERSTARCQMALASLRQDDGPPEERGARDGVASRIYRDLSRRLAAGDWTDTPLAGIARRMRLNADAVAAGLDRLEAAGMIDRDGGRTRLRGGGSGASPPPPPPASPPPLLLPPPAGDPVPPFCDGCQGRKRWLGMRPRPERLEPENRGMMITHPLVCGPLTHHEVDLIAVFRLQVGHEAEARVKAALAGAVAALQGMAGGTAPAGGTA
jgi:hypothetical protein